MKKSIIISIKPKWVEKILNGEKTIEIRKSMPKCDFPIDVYIYCTKGKGTKNQPSLCCVSLGAYNVETGEFEEFNTEYALNAWESLLPHFSILDGKIVAKFTLNKVEKFKVEYLPLLQEMGYVNPYTLINFTGNLKTKFLEQKSCLLLEDIYKYAKNKNVYAWHIDNLEIFDKPNLKVLKAPQSWCYAWR